jgi:hypothetical protein
MPNTYTELLKTTLGTATNSVTISSIPSGYTDLVLVINAGSSAGADANFRLNGDSGSNYSRTSITGNGSAASSSRTANATIGRLNFNGYPFGAAGDTTIIAHFMNYANTTTYKTVISRANQASLGTDAVVNLWRSTAAINSIEILSTAAATYVAGSTFSLYGIATQVAPGTAKATGGTITYDAYGNVTHTFTSSGTFTPNQALSVDYLVLAGGGSGAAFSSFNSGGGGGAGGLRCSVTATGGGGSLPSALAVTAQAYAVTVGAGGSGSNGTDSIFSSITSTGGGYGGTNSAAGATGGSGGGGSTESGYTAGGNGTTNQGYAGGAGVVLGDPGAGGGGGAGAVGGGGSTAAGGNGGTGVATFISGSSVTYGGGGGGARYPSASGTGGAGGGGNGASSGTAGSGTANLGGGGGGGGGLTTVRGPGGSGVVIIRYSGV